LRREKAGIRIAGGAQGENGLADQRGESSVRAILGEPTTVAGFVRIGARSPVSDIGETEREPVTAVGRSDILALPLTRRTQDVLIAGVQEVALAPFAQQEAVGAGTEVVEVR
jgi:hypothetical protein